MCKNTRPIGRKEGIMEVIQITDEEIIEQAALVRKVKAKAAITAATVEMETTRLFSLIVEKTKLDPTKGSYCHLTNKLFMNQYVDSMSHEDTQDRR